MKLIFALLLVAATSLADTYALQGTLVTPDDVIPNGVLLVRDGVILGAGAKVTIPPGTRVIDTGGFIYPGLIDLHNHLTWNAHPRWSPGTLIRNRYEWAAMDSFLAELKGPQHEVTDLADCDLERFAEVKALVWGATSVTGGLARACSRGLARNLDYAFSLLGSEVNQEPLQYQIFPLEMSPKDEKRVRDALANGKPVIVHLCEGTDASAARELRMLRNRELLAKGLVIIHGIPLLEKDFEELGQKEVGFVWSPRSNIALYGKTADVAAAKKHVTIAISPDWSPSGSSGMIEELRYAATWNDQQTPIVFRAQELVQMATSHAAKLAQIDGKVGRLAQGLFADYVVVRRGMRKDPYEALIYASHEEVLLVAVSGRPLYGDAILMQAVNPSAHVEAVTVCGASKALDMSDSDGGKGVSFAETMKNLRAAFGRFNLPMAGLAECH